MSSSSAPAVPLNGANEHATNYHTDHDTHNITIDTSSTCAATVPLPAYTYTAGVGRRRGPSATVVPSDTTTATPDRVPPYRVPPYRAADREGRGGASSRGIGHALLYPFSKRFWQVMHFFLRAVLLAFTGVGGAVVSSITAMKTAVRGASQMEETIPHTHRPYRRILYLFGSKMVLFFSELTKRLDCLDIFGRGTSGVNNISNSNSSPSKAFPFASLKYRVHVPTLAVLGVYGVLLLWLSMDSPTAVYAPRTDAQLKEDHVESDNSINKDGGEVMVDASSTLVGNLGVPNDSKSKSSSSSSSSSIGYAFLLPFATRPKDGASAGGTTDDDMGGGEWRGEPEDEEDIFDQVEGQGGTAEAASASSRRSEEFYRRQYAEYMLQRLQVERSLGFP